MKTFSRVALLAPLFACALSASAQQQPNMEEMMKAMGAAMAVLSSNAVPVVDFRDLKALLPAELKGMKRTTATGEKNGAMGMTVSHAEGRYENGGGSSIQIKLTDMGGTGAMSYMNLGWATAQIDRETDEGYEKTTTVGGHKAIEKYNTTGKDGEVQVLVNKRFMVEVHGNNVPMDTIKAALGQVDLTKLAALKAK